MTIVVLACANVSYFCPADSVFVGDDAYIVPWADVGIRPYN